VNAVVIGEATKNEAESGISDQVRRHLQSAAGELAAFVDIKLCNTGAVTVGVLADIMQQSLGAWSR